MTSPKDQLILAEGNGETGLAPAVIPANIDPEIIALAAVLHAQFQGEDAITKAQALNAALHVAKTGDVIGEDVYLATRGRVKGRLLDSYKGVQKRVGVLYQVKYRRPRPEEREEWGIPDDHDAMLCDCYVLPVWERCRKMGVEYEPITGIASYGPSDWTDRKGNPIPPPVTKTRVWKLKTASRKDALRQIPKGWRGDMDGDEIEDDDPDLEMSVADALEDAETHAQERIAELQEMTPEERIAEGEQYHRDTAPVDDQETCERCGQVVWPNGAHAPDCRVGVMQKARALQERFFPTGDNPSWHRKPDGHLLKLTHGALRCLCGSDDTLPDKIAVFLLGGRDLSQATAGECITFVDWIGAAKGDDGWIPSAQAAEDLSMLKRALNLPAAPEATA